MPDSMTPGEHYREAERLLASVTRATGLPLEAVEVEPHPQHAAVIREAAVHAALASAGTALMHRHLFAVHRHEPYPGHKPEPRRWHVHVWWRHMHLEGSP